MDFSPILQGWIHSSCMNLPGRQSHNCKEVQLKSLRALEKKINFVTMPNTYSDVSGTVIQGENQLSGTAGWGKSGVTPPKVQELHLHETVTREGSTRPWEPANRVWRQGTTGHKSRSNLMPRRQQGNLGQRGHSSARLTQANTEKYQKSSSSSLSTEGFSTSTWLASERPEDQVCWLLVSTFTLGQKPLSTEQDIYNI